MIHKKYTAFTLVELIVVITILAILGTLGYLSFVGYQLDARNSKRASDIKTLHTQIEILRVKGESFENMLFETGSTVIGGSISLWGFTGSINVPGTYLAWDINYTNIKVPKEDFLDPKFNVPYKMWFSSHLQTYQLAATVETPGWEYDIITSWSYAPRLWSVWNQARVERSWISGNTFYTTWVDAKSVGLLVWDQVWVSSWTYVITNIKANKVTVDTPITTPWQFLFLKTNESRYLIKKWDSDFPIDKGRGYRFVPYYSN